MEALEQRLYLSGSSVGQLAGGAADVGFDRLGEISTDANAEHHAKDGLDALWYLPPGYAGPRPLPGEERASDDANHYAASGFKWSQPGGPGSLVTVTYSYSNLLNGTLGGGLSAGQLRAAVEEALGLWAKVAPLNFVEVVDSGPPVSDASYSASGHPQIRIGHEYIDGAAGPNVLAHAWFPVGTGIGGDVHLDSANVWSLGPSAGIDIVEVLTHELGHTLGLGHEPMPVDGGDNAVMNPFYGKRFTGGLGSGYLLQDDVDGVRAIYGKGFGSVIPRDADDGGPATTDDYGNTAATAAPISLGSSTTGVLEYAGDQDWFRWEARAGTTYVFQTVLGTLADTTLRLYDRNGTSVLRSNDDRFGLGAASKFEWSAPADGTYFVSVQAPLFTQIGSYALLASVKNLPPQLAPIGNRTTSHNQDVLSIGLSAVDANGDPLTFSATVFKNSTPLSSGARVAVTGSTLTIDPPAGLLGRFRVQVTVSDGAFSDSEAFWVNVTNSPVSLAPIGDLTVSYAAGQLEIPLPITDADGDLLTYQVAVRGEDLAYKLDQTYGLYATPGLMLNDYDFNARGAGEKYLRGARGAKFVLYANGDLFRWKKSLGRSKYLATVDPSCYQNPSQLWNAQLALVEQASGIVGGNTLSINCPTHAHDTFTVQLSVSDGMTTASRTFVVTVTNSAPVLAPVGDHALTSGDGELQIPLTATDADGDPIAYSFALESGNPAWHIDQTHGLSATPELLAENYRYNAHGRREKYLLGDGGELFFLRRSGKLYQWGNRFRNSQLVAKLGKQHYQDPSLLWNAQPRGTDVATATISGNTLSISTLAGYTGSFRVTVTAGDGNSTDSETFVVIVAPELETDPPENPSAFVPEHVLYLDFDGADLSREKLIAWAGDDWRAVLDGQFDPESDGVRVEGFLLDWTEREAFIDRVVMLTQEQLAAFGVSVARHTGDAVAGVGATTIFVGVPDIAGAYEQWIGLASDVDLGNNNATDVAFALPFFVSESFDDNARALSNLIVHEAGHTWGLSHVDSGDAPDLMGLSHEDGGIAALARSDAGFLNQAFPQHGDGLGPQNSYATLAALFARPSPALSAEKSTRQAAFGELVATDAGTQLQSLA